MDNQYKGFLEEVKGIAESTNHIIPAHRSAAAKGYSISGIPFEEQLMIWDYVWNNGQSFWVRIHAFFFLERYMKKAEHHKILWDTSIAWQEKVADWSFCDSLAKINTRVLETLPEEVYPVLQAWNTHPDLWKRRQSVVSLLYFSRTKKKYLPYGQIEVLVRKLLDDAEYYVQKGVGWTLREMHTVYPVETMEFLKRNIAQIKPIAFTIAIEKMSAVEKEVLKAGRKKS